MFYSKNSSLLRLFVKYKIFLLEFFSNGRRNMKAKKHILMIFLLFLILFVCTSSVSAIENTTDDNSKNDVIGIGESPDGGTFNDLH